MTESQKSGERRLDSAKRIAYPLMAQQEVQMAYATIIINSKRMEFEVGVEVDGIVSRGGSYARGSDEPPWVEVNHVEVTHHKTGRKMSARFLAAISESDWEHIRQAIADAD